MPWPLAEKDLKRYPHFDAQIPLAKLIRIATTPTEVVRNAFFPFLKYEKRWKPFRRSESPKKPKVREIRYACRKDSAIYSYYRHILAQRYETELVTRGIATSPIAYRRIPGLHRGKCNIDFAWTAFEDVRRLKDCCAVTLDISSFFENIDHEILRAAWCALLGVTALPPDHKAVFKSITKYAVVDRQAAYERLAYFGDKQDANGRPSQGYLQHRRDIPIQLCSPSKFRNLICGEDGKQPSLIEKNKNAHGIPQGAPISDLLANLYLLDFDERLAKYVAERGGTYYRYSDDIFILIPGGEPEGRAAEAFATAEMCSCGPQLKISSAKTAVVTFSELEPGLQKPTRVDRPTSRGGLEYLGFRFDGRSVFIRESTMSKFHRGIRRAARLRAIQLVRRYPGKDQAFLTQAFNISDFERRFGRVADFERSLAHRSWTFRTYVKRCVAVFGDQGNRFFAQTRRHRSFIREASTEAIREAMNRNARKSAVAE
jgi:hypothetical protein